MQYLGLKKFIKMTYRSKIDLLIQIVKVEYLRIKLDIV